MKENKINIKFEELNLEKKTISQNNDNKNKLSFSLNISKGISDMVTKTQLSTNINKDGKIPLDTFFKDIDVTKKKLSEMRDEYDKKENNNINLSMKEYLNSLIFQICEKKYNKIRKKIYF